ncbi:hypothetical protein AAF712_013147 [Marasmius tenuissimus]|uniref:Uncharacterized protein n=1 Tax=Marasmius tenuissimus TaxID=585030 RepID=A0ABR2ZER9_9AGAR
MGQLLELGDHNKDDNDYDYDVDEDVSTVPPTGGMPVNTSAPCVSGTPELPADSQATGDGALKEGELANEPLSMEGSFIHSDSGKALRVLGEQGATGYKVENLRMTVETVAHERYGLDYCADFHDLCAYEAARDQFLRSSRGQVAVMLGGILSRIARELVVDLDVIFGPDMDVVYGQGRCFLDTMEGGYWDDELSEEEANLICDIYVIEKDTAKGSISQALHLSWWPRPGHFDAGSLNLDYWAPECEKWFQNRAREINRKPNTMSAYRWRKAMAMEHNLRRTPINNQAITQRFLDSSCL